MNHSADITPAALYARLSSDRQDLDLSVSAQLRALRDYADATATPSPASTRPRPRARDEHNPSRRIGTELTRNLRDHARTQKHVIRPGLFIS